MFTRITNRPEQHQAIAGEKSASSIIQQLGLQIGCFRYLNENILIVWTNISRFTFNYFTIWANTARICWIIAKRALYLIETIVNKLTSESSVYGSKCQSIDLLNSQQGQEVLDALLSESSIFVHIENEFKEKLDLLRMQAEESGTDPIFSYKPENDELGTNFQVIAQGELKLIADLLGQVAKSLAESEAAQVKSTINEAQKLLNITQSLDKGIVCSLDK